MQLNTFTNNKPGADEMLIDGMHYHKGGKVRLQPGKRRADAADMLLQGMIATIETIYTDYEDKVYLAITIDEDPGQQILREMGIYRFFLPDEVELLTE